jgi:hypothetical protein
MLIGAGRDIKKKCRGNQVVENKEKEKGEERKFNRMVTTK